MTQEIAQTIAENIAHITGQIGAARLMAVSKNQPEHAIRAALDCGHRLFGENRVGDAEKKWPQLRADYPGCELHLIGSLQTNKVLAALKLFDVIQSLDRESLLLAILKYPDLAAAKKFFVQVNIGHETQKSGIAPERAADFVRLCAQTHKLNVVGLMAIPPAMCDPTPYFRQLAAMAADLGLPELSMGMSGDLDIAVACGSTMVRVGTAIFGARE